MNFEIERDRILMKNETEKIVAEITFPETSQGVFVIDHTFVDESLNGIKVSAVCS